MLAADGIHRWLMTSLERGVYLVVTLDNSEDTFEYITEMYEAHLQVDRVIISWQSQPLHTPSNVFQFNDAGPAVDIFIANVPYVKRIQYASVPPIFSPTLNGLRQITVAGIWNTH